MEIVALVSSNYNNYNELNKNKKTSSKESDNKNDKKFSSTNDLSKYLRENFSSVKNGAVAISGKYLHECLKDDEKQKKLFENLETADQVFENAEKGKNVRVKIDSDGNMTVESSKTTVTFNESKRARQLAAAKTVKDVQALLNLLQNDLSECEEGLKNNWCDAEEVKKVKTMIERAKQKMSEVQKNESENNSAEENFSTFDIII